MRIRVRLPQHWTFVTELTVRVSDLNYGAHLGNDRVLTFFHEIRVRWLQSLGWAEMDMEGVGLIQTDAALQYKSQARLGDVLNGKLRVDEVHSRGLALRYQLEGRRDSREIARGSTSLLFFDYRRQALVSAPDRVLDRISG